MWKWQHGKFSNRWLTVTPWEDELQGKAEQREGSLRREALVEGQPGSVISVRKGKSQGRDESRAG